MPVRFQMRKLIAISLPGLILSVGISTTPLPPPPHKYFVSGTIQCDTILDLSDYTIQLYAKHEAGFSEYNPLVYFEQSVENHNLCLTDSTGNFYLESVSYSYHDSVKAGIIMPGGSPVFSNAIAVNINARREITDYFEDGDFGESGCSSCSSEPLVERVIRYEYTLDAVVIRLCN